MLHPLVRRHVGLHESGRLFEHPLTPLSMRLFSDHRLFGKHVLPGASHLGLVVSSCIMIGEDTRAAPLRIVPTNL